MTLLHETSPLGVVPPVSGSGKTPACGRPIHVLLIEDSQEHADLTTLLLTADSDDFHVERVNTLVAAMTRLSLSEVDIILLDLGMPELQGHRSYAAIRAIAPKTPAIIFTSDDSYLSRDLAWSSGVKDYLLKGETSGDQLQRAVRQALRNSPPGKGPAC